MRDAGVLGLLLLVGIGVWLTSAYLGLPVASTIVSGGSMYPTLSPGDMVLLVADRHPRPGEVVVYRGPGGEQVIHRVYTVGDGYAVMKGDNNPEPDPPVPVGRVEYRVVARVPPTLWGPLLGVALAASIALGCRGSAAYCLLAIELAATLTSALLGSAVINSVEGYPVKPTSLPSLHPLGGGVYSVETPVAAVYCGGCRVITPHTVYVPGGVSLVTLELDTKPPVNVTVVVPR